MILARSKAQQLLSLARLRYHSESKTGIVIGVMSLERFLLYLQLDNIISI